MPSAISHDLGNDSGNGLFCKVTGWRYGSHRRSCLDILRRWTVFRDHRKIPLFFFIRVLPRRSIFPEVRAKKLWTQNFPQNCEKVGGKMSRCFQSWRCRQCWHIPGVAFDRISPLFLFMFCVVEQEGLFRENRPVSCACFTHAWVDILSWLTYLCSFLATTAHSLQNIPNPRVKATRLSVVACWSSP